MPITETFYRRTPLRTDPFYVDHAIDKRKKLHKTTSEESEKIGVKSHTEITFLTTAGISHHVGITPSMEALLTAKQVNKGIFIDVFKTLSQRQKPYIPEEAEMEHHDTILFLAKNWTKLREKLYPLNTTGNVPPACFTEVVIDDKNMQRADFIGFGPDGRAFIIEVGKKSKSAQVRDYVTNFRTLFEDKISVTPLVAYYATNTTGKRVDIKPPFTPSYGHCNKALEYIQELGARNNSQREEEF